MQLQFCFKKCQTFKEQMRSKHREKERKKERESISKPYHLPTMLKPSHPVWRVFRFSPTMQTPINLCHVSPSQHSVITPCPSLLHQSCLSGYRSSSSGCHPPGQFTVCLIHTDVIYSRPLFPHMALIHRMKSVRRFP